MLRCSQGVRGRGSAGASPASPSRCCPPTMKFPLDPSIEEGREETESADLVSGAQAKRSDRTGHDASESGDIPGWEKVRARGVTLAVAETAGGTRQSIGGVPRRFPPSNDIASRSDSDTSRLEYPRKLRHHREQRPSVLRGGSWHALACGVSTFHYLCPLASRGVLGEPIRSRRINYGPLPALPRSTGGGKEGAGSSLATRGVGGESLGRVEI